MYYIMNYIAIIGITGGSFANPHHIYTSDLTDTEIYSQVGPHIFTSENHVHSSSPDEYLDPVSIHPHNASCTEQKENVCTPPPLASEEFMNTYAIVEPQIRKQPCQQQLEGRKA